MNNPKLSFLGAAREVGRSCFLLEAKEKVLLDAGVKLESEGTEYPMELQSNLDALVVSHAHLDHSGNVPYLFTQSYCPLYLTAPTLSLSNILWRDTLKICEYEGLPPRFSKEDIATVNDYAFPVEYRNQLYLSENMQMEFFQAGHILGAAMTKINFGEKNLLYTGDFKYTKTRLFPEADLNFGDVDYLIIESTYGDRDHANRKETEKMFVEAVQETLDQGGNVIIPAFAIGRSQEVLDILYDYKIDADIYFDGMGRKASNVFMDYPEYVLDPKKMKQALFNAKWVKDRKQREKVFRDKQAIVVSSAGMLQGGAIYNYLPHVLRDPKSSILMTGYQVEGTPGRVLMETGKFPFQEELVDVKARYEKFDFSAHAGQESLLKMVGKANPEKVFCVHGDTETIDVFIEKINELGFDAIGPELGQSFELK